MWEQLCLKLEHELCCFRHGFASVFRLYTKLMSGRKVGHRRVEDGHHKMGAHEAGRVACHASSLEWAVKLATCTFLSIKTNVFLGAFFYFKGAGVIYASPDCFKEYLCSLLLVIQFLRKIASHPLLHTASAFEVCCHVELRHVLYSAA